VKGLNRGKFILSRRHLPVLAQFAASNVLVAFDYDGTLAPIAATPAAARMRPKTRTLLARVAKRYPCVVLSGRPLDDLTRRLRRIPVWHLVGDHGFEPWGETREASAHVRGWVSQLRERLPVRKGLVIEQKRHSVTVHYRHVRDKRHVLPLLAEAVRELPHVRAIGGAEALNLIPGGGPNKGVALQQARRVFACDTAIYVGDDDTDEDAFASAEGDRLLSIRVGSKHPSVAHYRLRGQADVDALLELLLELREKRPHRPRRRGDTA
jgi:trehalose 6-phosphate phosphatase